MRIAMRRLINATKNSARAWDHLMRHEPAFQLEVVLLLLSLPLAWFLSVTWWDFALLVAVILVLMIVEVLNTAVEAACNALTREFRKEIQVAKDCGSLAVALAALLAAGVWLLAVFERLGWIDV
jgi:diacylglycerol kinase (ATP)